MNKKFSTLLAAFLAAGALTTANAQTVDPALASLAGTEKPAYVLGQGKYYLLHRTEYRGATAPTWAADASYYLTLTNGAAPELVFSNQASLRDKSAFWTLKDVTAPGEVMIGAATMVVQLVNAEGYTLAIDATTHKMATSATLKENRITRFYLDRNVNGKAILAYVVAGQKYVLGDSGTALSTGVYGVEGIANTGATSGTFNDLVVEEINEVLIPATELNAQLGSGFALSFQSKGEGYENLQGNVFTGNLKAIAITGSTSYYLQRADGQYIVLTNNVWSETTANLDGKKASAFRGYKFDAVSKHTFDNLTNKSLAQFEIYKSYDFNNTDSLIVTLPNAAALSADLAAEAQQSVKVFVSNVDSKNYVTVVKENKANDKLAAVNNDGYAATQVGAVAPYIKYGSENIVTAEDFRGKAWNIIRKSDGAVLSPDRSTATVDNVTYDFIPAKQVELTMPEGQWLPTANGFVNRESGETYNIFWSTVRKIGTDLYKVGDLEVIIKEVENAELGKTEKGYASFDMAVEALNGKYITLTDAVSGNTIYVAKDADDNVILSSDKSQAIEFRVKEITHDYTSHDGFAGVDTLQHYTTYLGYDKKGNKAECTDTVQFTHYMLYEHFSEKYLTYDYSEKKYVMTPWSRTDNKHENFSGATSFVIKVKGDGTYNLIRDYRPIYPVCKVSATGVHTAGDLFVPGDGLGYTPQFDNDFEADLINADKVYGAFQTATLGDMQYIYNFNDNDRFALEAVATPEYQTITTSQDTVVISRYGNPNIVMFEQNKDGINFLAMEHIADVEKMAPAMLADTAYVRNNTFKPQYLLGVATDIRVEEFCSRPDLHAALHKDTVYGRFLVNLVDSVTAKNVKTYTWDKTNFYKLGFVEGFHTDDYLYIVNNGKVSNKIFLGDNKDKVCTFAFRYVDEAREAVKIETAYSTADAWGNRLRGWIKWHNGVPVVINDYDQADLFVVDATTEEAPTANEAVAAEVSVVAAPGAIIVKGAAGKVVTVANILGQTIANQVAASDNVTIAAPAGIAVVTVDGEATKVVVK